jgi:hypothetical protein
VEVAAVVERRQGVEVGELARFAEAARVLDRRARPGSELFERGELGLGCLAGLAAPEDRKRADRLTLGVSQGNRDAAADEIALVADLVVRTRVTDANGARGLAARRAGHGLARCLVRGHSGGRKERLSSFGAREADEPCVHAGDRPGRLERPRENRVEVDGCADLSELTGALGLGARLLESRGEISVESLGACERFPQELLDRGVGASPPSNDHEEHDQSRDERKACRADGYTDGDPRCGVAHEKHRAPVPNFEAASPARTVTIIS